MCYARGEEYTGREGGREGYKGLSKDGGAGEWKRDRERELAKMKETRLVSYFQNHREMFAGWTT